MTDVTQDIVSSDGRTIRVHVPLIFRRRGGRKELLAPDGAPGWAPPPVRANITLVKALARAHRWRRMLESGAFGSISELAQAERISPSYLARILRLTLLAPEIVERILNGQHARALSLDQLLKPLSIEWTAQKLEP